MYWKAMPLLYLLKQGTGGSGRPADYMDGCGFLPAGVLRRRPWPVPLLLYKDVNRPYELPNLRPLKEHC